MYDLFIVGTIDDDAYLKFSEELKALELALEKGDTIEVELLSDGGNAYTALAFYDRIKRSVLNINITGTGFVASAATLVLAAGKKRRLTNSAWVMVHEDTVPGTKGLSVTETERETAHARRMEDQWNHMLGMVTQTTAQRWAELNEKTTYLTPSQCIELGLIEEIV